MGICPHSKTECSHYKRKCKSTTPSPLPDFWVGARAIYRNKFPPKDHCADDINMYPKFTFGRDGKAVKDLFLSYSLSQILELYAEYLNTDDKFFRQHAYDIPRFEKFVLAKATGGYGEIAKIATDNSKDELLSALKNHNNKAMPHLSERAKALFYSIGQQWSLLQSKAFLGEDIFVKSNKVDYKSRSSNDDTLLETGNV